ncbi:hypothetical protein E6C27_scaffold357G00420 [Cucumis melo var. makuwa]|uniref:NBS-LRR type resistance protein n=1 Tax=Cucumis melo var. makuwa TaxID=1194695 RepID=A0A5A7VAW0_CUCMM|nr:hypothetical protein E6C27_scaffold357G00420 [Cucumis melo var. makuwa]
MAFTHLSCPLSVCPSLGTLHKQSSGFVERTHQSRNPEGCTYQSSDPKDTRISLVTPKDTPIRLVIPKDAHISLMIPKDAHISLVIPKDTHISKEGGSGQVSLKPGQPRATVFRALDGGGVSRLGEVQRSTLLQRDGRPMEGMHEGENERTVTAVAVAGYEMEIGRADGETEWKRRDWRRGDNGEKLQRTVAAGPC